MANRLIGTITAEGRVAGEVACATMATTGGITPHIGENGNWWIGSYDTGKPSRGEDGEAVMTAMV